MEDRKKQLIEQLCTHGSVSIACKRAGISRGSFYKWQAADKSFKAMTQAAIKEAKK